MKITIIQTIVVIEDDHKHQPKHQPPVNPFLELIQRFQSEMVHGRIIREEQEHGTTFTQ
ncbi:MAG: hypothetical protein FWC50_03540 [Planctomycetaceae bacterium]|nr:hypothetical protein [Planctomycetaceae bacterium]